MTACTARLSWRGGALHVVAASAGHPGQVIVRADGRVHLLRGGGMALGLLPGARVAVQEFVASVWRRPFWRGLLCPPDGN
ncbi:MAG: SpoIIE family protein phosphatase [Streptosporangiaceae bacterium]